MRPRTPAAATNTPASEPWRPEAPLDGELDCAAAAPVAVAEDEPEPEPLEPLPEAVEAAAPDSVGVAEASG